MTLPERNLIGCPRLKEQLFDGTIDPDSLELGVIGFDRIGLVRLYNRYEAGAAGLSHGAVLGQPLFTAVAPCMNNFMVAERFESEAELDETVPYVLTLRMRPTRVQLRLLQRASAPLRFVLVGRT